MNFWKELPKPFFALAPMADVTDIAFRQIIAKYSKHGTPEGGPHVFWTEFVSADGLASKGREILKKNLLFEKNEHPIVAQIFGSNPKNIESSAKLASELGFDGVDLNMGCPDKSIEKQGAGASMIKTPEIAKEVIAAAKQGVLSDGRNIPVSVKTRVGYNVDEIDTWIPHILRAKPAALTIHARTRKEMSLVPARFEDVKRVVELAKGSGITIIGNGDVKGYRDGEKVAKESGADGIMIGRGIFGNPWLFDRNIEKEDIPLETQMSVMLEHTDLFEKYLGSFKNFAVMRKHYSAYIRGFDGARELRTRLMMTQSASEVHSIVNNFLKKSS